MSDQPAPQPDELEPRRRAREDRDETWERIVGRRFARARVEDLDGGLADAVADWRRDPTRNLLLIGPPSVGKTHAACAAARLAHDAGWQVRYSTLVELLDRLRPDGDAVRALAEAEDAHLLVLEDLGAERSGEWADERLLRIIDRRYRDMRPTIATSNLAVERDRGGRLSGPLVDAVGRRVLERLAEDAVRVAVAGESRRT